jgi:phosphatidate cytidylyltransferase
VSVPIILLCTYIGGLSYLFLVLILAIISLNEFYLLMQHKGHVPFVLIGNFFTLVFIIFAYQTVKHPVWEPAAAGVLTTAVILTFSMGIFVKNPKGAIDNIAVTVWGMIYIGWLFSYLILVRAQTTYGAYMFFLMGTIWAEDITAYLVGRMFGKHKLIPLVSPRKSVEGGIAGFIICVASALVFGHYADLGQIHSLILGIIIGVMAPVSDLTESLIKRDVGAKDSSALLPGHGGVLDRMDSFILTAPILYYYLSWFVLK